MSVLLARIVIERRISDEGSYVVTSEFSDAEGNTPPIVETLGMLELAKDSAIRQLMEEPT